MLSPVQTNQNGTTMSNRRAVTLVVRAPVSCNRGSISPAVGGNQSTGSMAVAEGTARTATFRPGVASSLCRSRKRQTITERDSRERPATILAGFTVSSADELATRRGGRWLPLRSFNSIGTQNARPAIFSASNPTTRGRILSGTVRTYCQS